MPLEFSIVDKKKIAEEIFEITLSSQEDFNFRAGQYVLVKIPRLLYDDLKGNSRGFSIASSPSNKRSISIVFRMSESGFKKTLVDLPIDSTVEVDGPFGAFILPEYSSKPINFIAGGIGITPFISILRFADGNSLSHKINLIYANRPLKEILYLKELKNLQKKNANFSLKTAFEKISPDFIKANSINFNESLWYISGPPQFVVYIKDLLNSLGIKDEDVFFEEAAEMVFSNKDQLMSIIKNNLEGIAITDLQGVIKFVNPAWENLTGWKAEEVINKTTPRILKSGKHTLDFYRKLWSDLLKGKAFRGEITNKRKDGSFYDTDEIIMPLRSPSGNIVSFAAFQRDITEKKSMEKELQINAAVSKSQKAAMINILEDFESLEIQLKQERDRANSILSSMEEGLAVIGPNGEIILMNARAEKLLDVSFAEIVNKNIHAIIDIRKGEQSVSQEKTPISIVLKEQKPAFIGLTDGLYFKTASGKKFPISMTISPLKINGGGAIIVFRDITKEEEIDRAKSEFVSLASHQLRTPPTIINWHTEFLLSESLGKFNDKQKEYLRDIYNANRRMIELINALLNVSRIELGTFILEQKPTNLIEIIRLNLSDLVEQIKEKKLQIIENYEESLPIINSDPNIIGIIFQNLIDNAVKYTQPGGKIEITIKKQASNFLIKISDSGCGIPKNIQGRMFSKFFRADNAKEIDPNGNGLGLYIVKAVLEQAGGKISFESEENKGTTFYIILPVNGTNKKEGTKSLEKTR